MEFGDEFGNIFPSEPILPSNVSVNIPGQILKSILLRNSAFTKVRAHDFFAIVK